MRLRGVLACVLGLAFGICAAAQTKISGTNHCAKPDPQNMVQVGDRPNHAFSVGQIKCTWTKPWKLAGIAGKEGIGTFSGEVEGTKSRDKAYYRYQGTSTLKDGTPQTEEGTWSLVRGTGKLQGLTGKGTYKGTAGADGTMTYEVQGEYQTPPKPSKE